MEMISRAFSAALSESMALSATHDIIYLYLEILVFSII